MGTSDILHETRHRLRLSAERHTDLDGLVARLAATPGVQSVRVNTSLRCIVVHHNGRPETRDTLLKRLRNPAQKLHRQRMRTAQPTGQVAFWATAALALVVPVLPQHWRSGASLGVVAARVVTQPGRLKNDLPGVLLDTASLVSLALSGQPMVVSTSVLLRQLSELLSKRLVREADRLLDELLPTEATHYPALRESAEGHTWTQWPVQALRAGDRVQLLAGDVVPVDGCVLSGTAVLAPAAHRVQPHPAYPGDHVWAGERLQDGTLEMYAEADAASSRLAKLRAQVQHAIESRDPIGPMTPGVERVLSLPLTASALVLGLTADSARAAAMLQADPQQGLDLAMPLAREAALYALARQGLLTAGLLTIERLATARTLVLQDTGVLTTGRWRIETVHTEPGGDSEQVLGWLAALAGTPLEILDKASFSDRVVRQWIRHGAVLRLGERELHLASRHRLQQVWALALGDLPPPTVKETLRRELAVVSSGRVVATAVLTSALRPDAIARVDELATLGFDRVAVFVEADGGCGWPHNIGEARGRQGPERIDDNPTSRSDWLDEAMRDGSPLLIVHTVLRDLIPPGCVSLTPMDADAGSHGVLLGDPLASLIAARRVAQTVHQRLHLQQLAATAGNAAMMTAAALRWLPPMGTALLHHGLALLLLLDSLRIESIQSQPDPFLPLPRLKPKPRTRRSTKVNTARSKTT
jgi:cation transport ATPase